jgi:hypothetical protein
MFYTPSGQGRDWIRDRCRVFACRQGKLDYPEFSETGGKADQFPRRSFGVLAHHPPQLQFFVQVLLQREIIAVSSLDA